MSRKQCNRLIFDFEFSFYVFGHSERYGKNTLETPKTRCTTHNYYVVVRISRRRHERLVDRECSVEFMRNVKCNKSMDFSRFGTRIVVLSEHDDLAKITV